MSAPGSPRFVSGLMTPGDIGTLTEEMQGLGTSDYMGVQSWESMMSRNKTDEDDEDHYPFPLVMKKRTGSVSSGLASGQTTPGTTNGKSAGKQKILNEEDLQKADEALSHHNGNSNGY
ncbi:hypothetical protein BCR35DRAFT_307329 [Leucosporidium creatinivorum]|nr:hypothetical protein BCR35DRAFT_307329 [Leucosporidium creatinivorum]